MTPQAARQLARQVSEALRCWVDAQQRTPSGWGGQTPLPELLDLAEWLEAVAVPTGGDSPRLVATTPTAPPEGAHDDRMDALLTYGEAARACRLSVRTLQRHAKSGSLRRVRIGKATRINPDDLAAWLEDRTS